jgi:transcriptional regulator with XRE-family HTH domain
MHPFGKFVHGSDVPPAYLSQQPLLQNTHILLFGHVRAMNTNRRFNLIEIEMAKRLQKHRLVNTEKNIIISPEYRQKLRKLPNCIRAWRVYRGLSQKTLATKSGMPRPTLSRLERGRLFYHQRILERLSVVLKCKPTDLIATNPFELPGILQIYARIPVSKRAQALKLLATYMGPHSS